MASGTQDLDRFVYKALERGEGRDSIHDALKSAGWNLEQIRSALAAYADVAYAVPVPRPRPYLSAREAFLYLVMFTTLYLSVYHLGSLLFDLINRAFPDTAVFTWGGPNSMRWSVASIIIAFPVFLSADPVTGQTYGYKVIGTTAFQLCATFDAPSEQDDRLPKQVDAWAHPAGLYCFDRHVDTAEVTP